MNNTEEINFIFRDYAVSIRPYIYEEDGHEVTKYHAFAVQNRFSHLFEEIIKAEEAGNDDSILQVLKDNGYQVESDKDFPEDLTLKTGHPLDELTIYHLLKPEYGIITILIEDEDFINPYAMVYHICREIEVEF
jgi:hypothetical protein